MTNGPWTDNSDIADDAGVLITISCSEAEGMVRRWGTVDRAIGDLSVQALVQGAVATEVVELLREQRPDQHANERAITDQLRQMLDSGHRIFVRGREDPIDSARAPHIQARSLLARGSPEYQSQSLYVLHLTVEPFGAASPAARHDPTAAAAAREALRHDMDSTAPPAGAGDDGAQPALASDALSDGYHLGDLEPADDYDQAREKWGAASIEAAPPAPAAEPPPQPTPEETAPQPAAIAAAVATQDEIAPEQVVAEALATGAETVEAQPRKYATKAEALTGQFRPKVEGLNFRGLFVGNFGYQRDTVVDVAKLSALSPQTISAYLMKANSLRQSGEHEKALSYYRVLLRADPENADYRFLYGKTLIEMGRIQPARECFERARELGHESAGLELERLERRASKKPTLAFLQFWRRAEE